MEEMFQYDICYKFFIVFKRFLGRFWPFLTFFRSLPGLNFDVY
jgi:hypothetical protein